MVSDNLFKFLALYFNNINNNNNNNNNNNIVNKRRPPLRVIITPKRYPIRIDYDYHNVRKAPLREEYEGASMENDGGLPLINLYDPDYSGPELHLPTHQYLGPGTNVAKRITSHVMPINRSDAVAMVHDIEYYGISEYKADHNAINNADGLTKSAMLVAFKLKDMFGGMKPKLNIPLYQQLKFIVQHYKPYKELLEKYNIRFYEDYTEHEDADLAISELSQGVQEDYSDNYWDYKSELSRRSFIDLT